MQNDRLYTSREDQILSAKGAERICYPEFLSLYHKAVQLHDRISLSTLEQSYPDYYAKSCFQDVPPMLDWDQSAHPFPILELPAGFSPCVRNMITYLTGDSYINENCMNYLYEHVKSTKRRNIRTEEIVHIFDEDSLWKDFFLQETSLAAIIQMKKISCLAELIIRTQEYFERADVAYFPPSRIF